MIKPLQDNILVKEIVKDSRAGNLIVSQDESSAYMFVKVLDISKEALENITSGLNELEGYVLNNLISGDFLIIISRTAKLPFVQDMFFISYKDIRAIIDKKEFEEL